MSADALKILIVSREYPPETGGGGIGSYVESIAPALASLGHEVHVLSCDFGQAARDYVDRGVFVHRRPNLEIRGFARLWRLLRAPEEAAGTLIGAISAYVHHRRLGVRFDVVEHADWAAEGLIFALRRDTPLVAQLHAPMPVIRAHAGVTLNARGAAWISAFERVAVARSDVVTAPAPFLVGWLRARGWLRRDDVEIVPLPVDWHAWSDVPPASEAGPVVLFIGKIVPLKAPEVLVEAMELLRAEIPGAQALFVARFGETRDGYPAFEWVGRRLAFDGCEFTGFVPRSELAPYVARGRVLALTSLFENFSMVALEALASGRDVVASDTTGVASFLSANGLGAVVPVGDARALAAALRPYLLDAQFASERGERGRAVARRLLDPAVIAARRVAAYRRAMALHGRRAARGARRAPQPATP